MSPITKKLFTRTFAVLISFCLLLPTLVAAQSLEGRIADTITRLVIILNLLLVGAIAWNGFLLFSGEQSAVRRLMFTVAALVVVNSSRLIMDFFI
jgi:hypothetical protein